MRYLEGLYSQVNDLRDKVEADALHPNAKSTFSVFSDNIDTLMTKFTTIERQAYRVRNMQTNLKFDPDDPSFELNHRSWARGVDCLIVTTERALRTNPIMMAHLSHRVWIGPVLINMILINDEFVVVEGIRRPDGSSTTMCSSRSEVLQIVQSVFTTTLAASDQAFPPGTISPSCRQIQIARGMARGWSDSHLSHELGVSQRTVERDIAALYVFLGASNRSDAISRMNGRIYEEPHFPHQTLLNNPKR